MSGEEIKVKYTVYNSLSTYADNGVKTPAAEKKQAKPAMEGKKSIPAYLLDGIGILADLITGGTLVYGQDSSASITDKELEGLNAFADSSTGVAPFLAGTTDKAEIKNNNGKGIATVRSKTINFSVKGKPYIDQSILPYFKSEKYPEMVTVGKILSSLDPSEAASFSTPEQLIDMFINFQTNCNRYKIYARYHEKKTYEPVVVDGVLGRQTSKALVFVYELGQLSVRFQIVGSFKDYVDIFNGVSKKKLKFKDIVSRIEDIVTRLQESGTSILKNKPIDNKIGVIMNNVGDAIIELYLIKDIKEANLFNIAAQKKRSSSDKSVLVLPYIKETDAIEGTNYAAMREVKTLLYILGKYRLDASSIDDFDGTWDGEFDKALKEIGVNNKTIDADSANVLFEKGRAEYVKTKKEVEELYVKVEAKPEIVGDKKTGIRSKLDEIYTNYDLTKPESIAKSVIEMRKIISEEKGLLGTLEKVEFLRLQSLLKKKYAYLKTIITDAGDLIKPDETSKTKEIEPVIEKTGKMIEKDEWQTKGVELKKQIDDATALCSHYIINFLIRIFSKKNGEIKEGIASVDIAALDEISDDTEFNNTVNGYKQKLIELSKGVDGLADIVVTITNEKAKQENIDAAKGMVDGLRGGINIKRNDIEEIILFIPIRKQKVKLTRMVNDAISEVNAYSDGEELKKVKDKLTVEYDAKVKDDASQIADQKQLFSKNDITAESKIKTVNEPGRQANAILSIAQDLDIITGEKRRNFLAKRVTPEIKRLIDAIEARQKALDEGAVGFGNFAPVSALRATEVMYWRYLVYRQTYIPCRKERVIFEKDPAIPDDSKKVMPLVISSCKLQKNNKRYLSAAKSLYDKVLAAVAGKNEDKQRVTNMMSFEEAIEAELQGGTVSYATMCVVTVVAKEKKLTIEEGMYDKALLKEKINMIASVKKELYEKMLEYSEKDRGLPEIKPEKPKKQKKSEKMVK